jgi:thiol-disulfide isomerase/thioredoxin
MRLSTLLFMSSLLIGGCLDKDDDDDDDDDDESSDSDGDGLSNEDEEALGSDPDNADTDGDGIDDGAEVEAGTDPTNADTDGDGLGDEEELALGTDATSPDTDGDGFEDGEELDAESDPVNPFSWPFGGEQWPDFTDEADEAGIDGSEYAMGSTFPNFTTTDQFGNEVELYNFYGMVVLLDFSAGWCGPCRTAAAESEEMWEEYREDGFIILHAMIDNNSGSGSVSQGFLEDWADDYDIEFPVINGDQSSEIYSGAYYV